MVRFKKVLKIMFILLCSLFLLVSCNKKDVVVYRASDNTEWDTRDLARLQNNFIFEMKRLEIDRLYIDGKISQFARHDLQMRHIMDFSEINVVEVVKINK